MSSSIRSDFSPNNVTCSSVFNQLNNLHDRLNHLLTNKYQFVQNLEELLSRIRQLIDQFSEGKSLEDLNRRKEEFDHLINLFIPNLQRDPNSLQTIKQTIELIKQHFIEMQNDFSSKEIDQSTIEERDLSPTMESTNRSSSDQSDESSKEVYSYEIRLQVQNSYYPYLINAKRRINLPLNHCCAFSTNEKHLVIVGQSRISLFNNKLQIIGEKCFNEGKLIQDICWSKSLDRFLLISAKKLFLLDNKRMIIQTYQLYFHLNKPWHRISSSEKFLFLSTYGANPSLVQFHLFPSIQFAKKYEKQMFVNGNECVNDIQTDENSILMIIEENRTNKSFSRIYLLKSFQLICNVYLGQGWNYRSSLFNQRYWMISDYHNHRFIYLLNDGNIIKTESYFDKPINVRYWNDNEVIIQTNQYFYIHQSQ